MMSVVNRRYSWPIWVEDKWTKDPYASQAWRLVFVYEFAPYVLRDKIVALASEWRSKDFQQQVATQYYLIVMSIESKVDELWLSALPVDTPSGE